MRTSPLSEALAAIPLVLAIAAGSVFATPQLPTPQPLWRTPRTDYVKTWYIYNDKNCDGILDAGDQKIAAFQNWWTPVSAHTQNNMAPGPYGNNGFMYGPNDHKSSAPMNFASSTNAMDNLWLPREKNTVAFYMTYSQFDNNNWATYNAGLSGLEGNVVQNRNLNRNGWGLGWVTGDNIQDGNGNYSNDQTLIGTTKMDIYVHDGRANVNVPGFGPSSSSPQVATSNNISNDALMGTQYHPPQFDTSTNTYSVAANTARMAYQNWTAGSLQNIVNSMEFRQYDPYGPEVAAQAVSARTPQAILDAGLTDTHGVPYVYQDAMLDRSTYVNGAASGGVIAGLGGTSNYSHSVNNWGDQQVIRIDFSASDFASASTADGKITKVVFYDFTDQLNPVPIVLDLSNLNLFPESRFYIAEVDIAPEPATMAILVLGGAIIALRRKARGSKAA